MLQLARHDGRVAGGVVSVAVLHAVVVDVDVTGDGRVMAKL